MSKSPIDWSHYPDCQAELHHGGVPDADWDMVDRVYRLLPPINAGRYVNTAMLGENIIPSRLTNSRFLDFILAKLYEDEVGINAVKKHMILQTVTKDGFSEHDVVEAFTVLEAGVNAAILKHLRVDAMDIPDKARPTSNLPIEEITPHNSWKIR